MTNELIMMIAAAMAQASPDTPAATATAQTQEVAASDAQDEAKKDKERVICKRYAKTGTRVKEKVCYTAAQWKQIRDRAQELGTTIQRRGGIDAVRRDGG